MANDGKSALRSLKGEPAPSTFVHSDRPVAKAIVQPALKFMRAEASGGIIMLFAAIAAVAIANSPLGDGYTAFFNTPITISFGEWDPFHHIDHLSLKLWINDAAMVIFFFVVGLEIKRELVVGELRDPRAAALPALAALGGMVVPAAFFVYFNQGLESSGGWGIPMATDIAFAIGVIALVGKSVPIAAKLFLLALAIVDDLGAIMVIAVFYTEELAALWLVGAAVGLVVIHLMKRAQVRAITAYVIVGVLVWLCVLESGVHATLAGVAIALMTPLGSFYSPNKFRARAHELIDRIDEYMPDVDDMREVDHHTQARVHAMTRDLNRLSDDSVPPLQRLEDTLTPWSSYLIVPLFAFANAGVVISGDMLNGIVTEPVFLGVGLGLVLGKLLGVVGFTWIAVKTGIGTLPRNTSWGHVFGLALLAGIGFTVALFVSELAFAGESLAIYNDQAKLGIFAASFISGVGGFVWLKFFAKPPNGPQVRDDDSDIAHQAPESVSV